ncbi:hypothetical protein [Agrobacterium tumefaciens]|uniref:hypothetical protein n=1 Tax=Agrobacterium tumefaciens TaxID=358 RepID=UPI000DD2E483|nr:hypothetical protein [Agrobacterium tumefaciens]MEA1844590.1 hypothetical protein [Agrobacterium tumefaciens]NSY61493.1 hypothetical protein [Agrobacterium tumefaciens]
MIQEPVEKYFGTPISEWIARVANELEVDAVGLWQIIPVGIDSFGLSDEQLEDFGYLCVVALLKRGAVPVKSSSELPGWVPEMKYHGSHEEMAMQIISDWKAGKLVPDHDGLWFALLP